MGFFFFLMMSPSDVFARLSAADQKDATEATSIRKHLVNQSMMELENMNEIGPPIPLD
jgi:hypothetical protein